VASLILQRLRRRNTGRDAMLSNDYCCLGAFGNG
jgi:hypothetical protein